MGSLQRLPALIGLGRTKMLAMTCKVFDGNDAVAYGLVHGPPSRSLEELQVR